MLKDPNATLDYGFNWASWLGTDTITSSTWTVTGATKDSDTHDTTTTTVWLSAGVVGTPIVAMNRIVTAGGRTDDRTMVITVREK
jgi:hypothetical protein